MLTPTKTPIPARLVIQHNEQGVTLFNENDEWVGVFRYESHAIQFARNVLGYTGDFE